MSVGGRGGVMLVVVVQIFHHRPQTPSDLGLTPHPWPLRSWHRSLIHGLRVMHEALKMTSQLVLVSVLVFVLFTISQL